MSDPAVTLSETCDILAALEPRLPAPSYWRLRWLLLGLGIDAQRVASGARQAWLLSPLDVGLCRLWHRMTGDSERQSARVAALIANNRETLIAALQRPTGRVFLVRGVRGDVLPADVVADLPGELYVLSDLTDGVTAAMARVRRSHPCIWNGTRYVLPQDVASVPASVIHAGPKVSRETCLLATT